MKLIHEYLYEPLHLHAVDMLYTSDIFNAKYFEQSYFYLYIV